MICSDQILQFGGESGTLQGGSKIMDVRYEVPIWDSGAIEIKVASHPESYYVER